MISKYKILIVIIIIFVNFTGTLKSQNIIQTNPADIADSRSFFLNPATIPYQPSQLMMAIKILHLGFFDDNKYSLRHQFAGLSIPGLIKGHLGAALTGQTFNSPYYNQTNFSLALSQKITYNVAVGAKLNLFNKSYNLESFELFDMDDPVFAKGTSKTTLSFGVGVFVMPIPDFSFGLSIDHINQPDISLVDAHVKQPMSTDLGFKYTYKFLALSSNFNYREQNLSSNIFLEMFLLDLAKVRVGYGFETFKIETQFYLFKGLNINYHWDYPNNDLNKVSSGSHEVGVIYNFDWFFKSGFEVNSRVRTLEISRRSKTIIIDEGITAKDLETLTEEDLDILPNIKPVDSNNKISRLLNEVVTDSEVVSHLTPRYRQSIDHISSQLDKRKDLKVEIIVPEGTEDRALTIKNRMTNDWGISENKVKLISLQNNLTPAKTKTTKNFQRLTKLDSIREVLKYQKNQQLIIKQDFIEGYSQDSTIFHINPVNRKKPVKRWQFIIERKDGQPVKIFGGWKLIPERISWNWLDDNFEFIKPGTYFYHLKWQDTNDQFHHTPRKILSVRKHPSRVTLLLTKESKEQELRDIGKKVSGIQLILRENNSKK